MNLAGEDHRTSLEEARHTSSGEDRHTSCIALPAEAGPEKAGRQPEAGLKEGAGRPADIHW